MYATASSNISAVLVCCQEGSRTSSQQIAYKNFTQKFDVLCASLDWWKV